MKQERPYVLRIADLYKRKRRDFGKALLRVLNSDLGDNVVEYHHGPPPWNLPPIVEPREAEAWTVGKLIQRAGEAYRRGEVIVLGGDTSKPFVRVPGFTAGEVEKLRALYSGAIREALFVESTYPDADREERGTIQTWKGGPWDDDAYYNPDYDPHKHPEAAVDLVISAIPEGDGPEWPWLDPETVSRALEELFEVIMSPTLDLGRCEGLRLEDPPRRPLDAPFEIPKLSVVPCERWFVKTRQAGRKRYCGDECRMRAWRASKSSAKDAPHQK